MQISFQHHIAMKGLPCMEILVDNELISTSSIDKHTSENV